VRVMDYCAVKRRPDQRSFALFHNNCDRANLCISIYAMVML
jgi:hypothetical protein